jgi:hypothetical protein
MLSAKHRGNMAKTFDVTVQRVNESAHKAAEFSVKAIALKVDEEGTLSITTETGAQVHGETTWGSIQIVRVPAR